jgi:hypothetical protein
MVAVARGPLQARPLAVEERRVGTGYEALDSARLELDIGGIGAPQTRRVPSRDPGES